MKSLGVKFVVPLYALTNLAIINILYDIRGKTKDTMKIGQIDVR